jgi:hypothetical protein
MQFSKIAISKDDEVSLARVDVHKHSKDAIETGGVNPLGSFKDAVAAFLPLFLRVVPALEAVKDKLRVSTLSLSDKDGDRMVQISATLACDACNGAGISMTTPRLTIPPEGAKEGQVYLGRAELKLIDNVEAEATRYAQGETAQVDAFATTSENATEVKERMASASADTTRVPHERKTRGKKAPTAPAADAPLSNGGLRSLLGTVDYDVPLAKIDAWTTEDRAEAQAWGTQCQQAMGKSETPPPACVARDAVEWTGPVPPRATDVTPIRPHVQ